MTKYHETKGLVLHSMPVGEYDKRLVILTKEYGKIIAFAKGAKKTSSKYIAGSEVFAYGDYSLYRGKNSYSLTGVSLVANFRGLTTDIESLSYGLYVLEVVEYISVENAPNVDVMELVLRTLQAIEKHRIDYNLILIIFQLKLLSFLGFMPELNGCVRCGSVEGLNAFDVKEGGVVCNLCKKKHSNYLEIHDNTREIMAYIIATEIKKLYGFKVSEMVYDEMSRIIKRYFEYHIHRKFNSLDLLTDMLI